MTLMQRIRRWSQKTARVYEASLLIMMLGCIRLVFGPGSLLMVMATPDVTMTSKELTEAFLVAFLVTWPIDLGIIWSARRHLSHRSTHYFYWFSFGCVVVLSVVTLLNGAGIIPFMQWYKQSTGARTLVFSFISLTYFFQSVCWYLADWERFTNASSSALRRNIKRFLVCLPLLVAVAIPCVRYVSRQSEPPILVGPTESFQLDGVDDYLTVENVGFDAQSPLTLEAWIRPEKPHRGVIASHGPFAMTVVAAGSGNRFRIHLSVSNDRVYLLDAEDVFGLNLWTHVAMTRDGSEIKMYVNGQRQGYDVSVYNNATNIVTPNVKLPDSLVISDLWPGSRFLIGNFLLNDPSVHFQFAGRIGEVRLNRSLFYHEEFKPEPSLAVVPETVLLFHLRDGQVQFQDATGRYTALSQP